MNTAYAHLFGRPPWNNTNLLESAARFFQPKPLSGPCYFPCPGRQYKDLALRPSSTPSITSK
ncbi:hypothetical protein F2Q69_00015394 [Brassica cretica]|uniref:Uncharacterized protein n=1 Tax=Brassica cretica TaxID=69181 RepID=A0A8S9QUQ4_BRACR|nr:hypothetical protein F2Q69_00015394 [Brassica cretica]